MVDPALASAEWWLAAIHTGKVVCGFLVAIGVAGEFLGDWLSGPFQKTIDDAKELLITTLNTKAETATNESAQANARAKALEKDAAQARLEQEQLKARLAWRNLNDSQFAAIVARLTPLHDQLKIGLGAIANDPESILFAQDIKRALAAAGFGDVFLSTQVLFSNEPVTGIVVHGVDEATIRLVAQGFLDAGFSVRGEVRPGDPEILVGSKPPPAHP